VSIWKKVAACAATALACLVLITAPAAAEAYPVSHFGPTWRPTAYFNHTPGPSYGATWARGTITWYDRSLLVEGEVRVVNGSGCRVVVAEAYSSHAQDPNEPLDRRSTSQKCGDGVIPFQLKLDADLPGGANSITFCLTDGKKTLACTGHYTTVDDHIS
jgi:hypothetical protein